MLRKKMMGRLGDNINTINISHLEKRKIILKMPFLVDMLVPWRVHVFVAALLQIGERPSIRCQIREGFTNPPEGPT